LAIDGETKSEMQPFLNTAILYFIALSLHLLIWRIRLPKRQLPSLLVLFGVVFLLWIATPFAWRLDLVGLLHVALFYTSISLAYVITYSAIEGDSPTLSLIYFVSKAGEKGVPAADVDQFSAKRPFIKARLKALLVSRVIVERDGSFVLAGNPSLAFRLILGFRKIYGPMPRGG
jgi:hypothetical protein